MTTHKPSFTRGADAMEQATKRAGGGPRTSYFSLKDGEQAMLRFVTDHDEWLTVQQHNYVPTKARPDGFAGENWPSSMSAVCRREPAFELPDGWMHEDCFICEHVPGRDGGPHKPQRRGWALAVLREEVKDDEGRMIGITDQQREVERSTQSGGTETVQERSIVVVNMGYQNFFGAIKGFANYYGTVLDRDFLVKRRGAGTDTDYDIIPLDPLTDEDGNRFDLRNEEHMALYRGDGPSFGEMLEDIVMNNASDDYYALFFDTRVSAPASALKKSDGEGDSNQPSAPKPTSDVDPQHLEAMAQRVKSYGQQGGGDQQSPQQGGMRSY